MLKPPSSEVTETVQSPAGTFTIGTTIVEEVMEDGTREIPLTRTETVADVGKLTPVMVRIPFTEREIGETADIWAGDVYERVIAEALAMLAPLKVGCTVTDDPEVPADQRHSISSAD